MTALLPALGVLGFWFLWLYPLPSNSNAPLGWALLGSSCSPAQPRLPTDEATVELRWGSRRKYSPTFDQIRWALQSSGRLDYPGLARRCAADVSKWASVKVVPLGSAGQYTLEYINHWSAHRHFTCGAVVSDERRISAFFAFAAGDNDGFASICEWQLGPHPYFK